ncbi:MAG: response regulator [Ardenticatenia bacterium]|uniref:Chemotaxis protein CheY n=1 Tax=Ardenticatena maritima TaxID=872965 RepID=A0A0M8K7C5_9CHLR|nr:response regulator [Ardenticatena maritima]KPL89152.1 chemotaxis protein CheY [Ardenticatena maritima]RME09839.1 MAG: response regulator [Ardenticatenia bacterium]GAP63293.1 two-component system, cell cycle response regulator DivK [Ardenticatena maritima]
MAKARILYIEDNLANRELVKRILEIEGYEVLEAEDGYAGYEAAVSLQPDLILMDINLPEIDGLTLTARLRQHQQLRDIPIIALTANVMKGDREKTLAAGCDGYIRKPVDVDELPIQVERFLKLSRERRGIEG